MKKTAMAQRDLFGAAEMTPISEPSNIFGSSIETSKTNADIFGSQSDSPFNMSQTLSGQATIPFGSFGGQTSRMSNPFGSLSQFGTVNGSADTFGHSSSVPVFGGQSGSSGTFSSVPVFGGQSSSTGTSSSIPVFGGQSSSIGTSSSIPVFGGQSSSIGTSSSIPVFGGQSSSIGTSSSIPIFGGQSSFTGTSSSVPIYGGQSSFTGTSSSMPIFGGQSSSAETSSSIPIFGGQSGSTGTSPSVPIFGGQSGSATSASVFGKNFVFGAGAAAGDNEQTTSAGSRSTSHIFGSARSVSGPSPFDTSKPSVVFSINNPSHSSSLEGVGTSSSVLSTSQSTHSLPTTNQTQQSSITATSFGAPLVPSSFPTKSSSIFGSFPVSSLQSTPTAGAVFGTLSSSVSTGVRKRNSSGAVGESTLFGKQDLKASGLFGVSSSGTSEISLKQSAPLPTAGALFGGAASSTSQPVVAFPSSTSSAGSLRPEDKTSYDQKQMVASENVLFGKPLSESNSGKNIGQQQTARKAQVSTSTKLLEKNQGLFDKNEGLLSQSRNKMQGLKRTASSFNLAQQSKRDDHRADKSPQKSLSKWSRGKDSSQLDRKGRDLPSLSESQKDSKRSRSSEDAKAASSPAPRARSSSTRLSVEDLTSKNTVIVKDIPVHLNNGPTLRKHFSQFGKITRLQTLVMKRTANITFETHEGAAAAKNEGKYLVPGGSPLSIFWRAGSKVKSPDDKWAQVKESQRRPQRASAAPGTVEDELASLSELHPDFKEEPSLPAPSKQHVVARKRSPTPPPAPQVLDADVAKGLFKALWQAKAKDVSERIAILDSRDKLLRLLRGRQQSDLATAKAFVGICPDMCPEKERYYREDIRRLSVYEVLPGTMTSVTGLKSKVDHFRAVKEYSRSSADQEEPLPHELRPLPVLVTTMNYLMTHIADAGGDGSWAEWYDFLWNRTRGIRKDITQQQLCDIQVAELLEKCARFHIFCSERLCEEDMMSFDAKINSENLTKCHQTLKELYVDLEKRGVYCPNEAEFRAYMVLMNLNEGDILREIQQLRPEIRDSPHISFAVQAYNALNANNYVRFFRLIEEKATFLSACILHRYFNQIRSKALLIIMKAHGALGKNVVLYPIEEMIHLLCFENASEVAAFCSHYGISLKGADVMLDSKAYIEPEGSLPQTRSQSLIEIKQENMSIGEVINGGALPPLQLPTPSSSFNEDGVFIMSSDVQEALGTSKLFRTKPPPHEEVKVQRGRPQYSNEVVKNVARNVILEVIDASITEIVNDIIREERLVSTIILSKIEDIVNTAVEETIRQIAQEVYDEEESELKKKIAEELAAQRRRACTVLCGEIVNDAVLVMAKEMANEEMSLVRAELLKQQRERCSQSCRDEMLSQIVEEMTEDVVVEVYEVDVVMKRERLEAAEKLVEVMRCRRFLQAWRLRYMAQIRVKRAMLDFPSAPPAGSLHEQIEKLLPVRPHSRISEKSFYIGERTKLSIDSPMDVIQKQLHLSVHLSMASARHMLASLLLWRPLDLVQTVGPQLHRAFLSWKSRGQTEPDTARLQWKLILSIPRIESSSPVEESTFARWLRAKLCRDVEKESLLNTTPTYEGEVLSLYHKKGASRKQAGFCLGLCVRCLHGAWTDDEEISVRKKELLKGACAVMFVLPRAESLHSQQQHLLWSKEKQRLHQILKLKPSNPAIPLVIIVPRILSSSKIPLRVLDEKLELSSLHRESVISAVHVIQPFIGDQEQPLTYFEDWTVQLSSCLRFAANGASPPPKLRAKTVSDYVEDAVVELYKTSVYEDLQARLRQQMLHQSPNKLLSLYNDVVGHAAMVCVSASLAQLSWPAPEFDKTVPEGEPRSLWNTEAHMCDLYELVSKVRLPYFRYSDMEADDWSAVCRDVWSYVAMVTKEDSGSAKIELYQRVTQLLSSTKKVFDQFCWLADSSGLCEPTYVNMPWTDLIDACIHYKLVSLRTGHISLWRPDEEQKDELEDEEMIIYYLESELSDWEPPLTWLDALRDTQTSGSGHLRLTVDKAADVKREKSVVSGAEASVLGEGATAAASFERTVDWVDKNEVTLMDTSYSSLTDLKNMLQEEKAASEKYERSLESSLLGSCSSVSEAEPEMDTLAPGSFLSPIQASNTASSQNPALHVGQFSFFSGPKQNNKADAGQIFKTSYGSPHRLTWSAPLNHRGLRGSPLSARRESSLCMDSSFDLSPTLSDKVSDLHSMIESEKQADVLFEMRLKSLLNPTFS